MKTVIFDVDGVLADFVYGFTTTYGIGPFGNRDVPYSGWGFDAGFNKERVNETWEKIKSDPHWWERLPALVPTRTFLVINSLQNKHHILFVTSRVSYHNVQHQTQNWLAMQGVRCANVVVSSKKGEIAAAVGADYHIDDKPENAACVHWIADKKPCSSYFLEYPQIQTNWLPSRVRRVFSVQEFIDDVRRGA